MYIDRNWQQWRYILVNLPINFSRRSTTLPKFWKKKERKKACASIYAYVFLPYVMHESKNSLNFPLNWLQHLTILFIIELNKICNLFILKLCKNHVLILKTHLYCFLLLNRLGSSLLANKHLWEQSLPRSRKNRKSVCLSYFHCSICPDTYIKLHVILL